jgi:hypothetical protein
MVGMKNELDQACFLEPILSGVAGEYFVAAELSRRGYIASISLRNTRGIDIIVTNKTAARSVTIQCKTNQGGKRVWLLNEKCERFFEQDHFYVFVALGALDQRPSYPKGLRCVSRFGMAADLCPGPLRRAASAQRATGAALD